jgi:hypothetical protein
MVASLCERSVAAAEPKRRRAATRDRPSPVMWRVAPTDAAQRSGPRAAGSEPRGAALPEAAACYARAIEIAKLSGSDSDLLFELNVRHAEQLVLLNDLQAAKTPIEEAERLAALAPNRVLNARLAAAEAHLAYLDTSTFDEARIFDAIELFEEMGDHASAARAWWAIANVRCGESDRLSGAEASERMLECAKRSGSSALTNEARRHLAALLALGAVPIPEAVARVHALFDETTDPHIKARMLVNLGWLEARQARFDEGRALMADARALTPPRRRTEFESFAFAYGSRLEYWAGNMHRAEEFARANAAYLWSEGLVRILSSELLPLADALIAADRKASAHDAAAETLRISQTQGNVVLAQRVHELLGARERVVAG